MSDISGEARDLKSSGEIQAGADPYRAARQFERMMHPLSEIRRPREAEREEGAGELIARIIYDTETGDVTYERPGDGEKEKSPGA